MPLTTEIVSTFETFEDTEVEVTTLNSDEETDAVVRIIFEDCTLDLSEEDVQNLREALNASGF